MSAVLPEHPLTIKRDPAVPEEGGSFLLVDDNENLQVGVQCGHGVYGPGET